MDARIPDILDFWFVDHQEPQPQMDLWFSSSKQQDEEVAQRFGALVDQAMDRSLTEWADYAKGRLALILLLDQFSRQLFRGQAKAFAGDDLAQTLCTEGINQNHDLKLSPLERAFFYMPLMHSESLHLQELSCKYFAKLTEESDLNGFYHSAIEHKELIERFGRYPHRNQVLNRTDTPEEVEYLKTGKRFGQ